MLKLRPIVTTLMLSFVASIAAGQEEQDVTQPEVPTPTPTTAAEGQEEEVITPEEPSSYPLWNDKGKDGGFGLTLVWSQFKPLGADTDWEITGYDIVLEMDKKRKISGPAYWGWGAGGFFGFGTEDFPGAMDENYGRAGLDAELEFGARVPIGSKMHLDAGVQLGGYGDYGGGRETSFSYSHLILWGGPALKFEPNGSASGITAGVSYRLPIAGSFGINNLVGYSDPTFDVDDGSVMIFEVGYQNKSKGMGFKAFVEINAFEYEVIGDQERTAVGIALTGSFF